MIRGVDGATTHFRGSRGLPVVGPTEREKLTAGIVHDLVELSNADLARVRWFVAGVLGTAKESGTARKLDGATLAREQAEREAGPWTEEERARKYAPGFGCHHAQLCEGACPVPSFPPVEGFDTREEAQDECDRANVVTLLDLHDESGGRLRVEHDRDDGRSFVICGEPDAEQIFEIDAHAVPRIVGTLRALPAPFAAGMTLGGDGVVEAVQQGKAPVKHVCGSDCEWCEVPR